MQYPEINDVTMSVGGGQLVDYPSTSREAEHEDNIDEEINKTHTNKMLMMKSCRPFKFSTAVIFVTAYILTALLLPGKP